MQPGLRGKTDWCSLEVTWSQADCWTKNSYAINVILAQLLPGLNSREFHEKVLQKGDNINLDNTLVLLESLEHGRAVDAKLEKAHGGSVVAVGTTLGAKAKGGGKKSMSSQKWGTKQGEGGNKTHPFHCSGSTKHKGGFLE